MCCYYLPCVFAIKISLSLRSVESSGCWRLFEKVCGREKNWGEKLILWLRRPWVKMFRHDEGNSRYSLIFSPHENFDACREQHSLRRAGRYMLEFKVMFVKCKTSRKIEHSFFFIFFSYYFLFSPYFCISLLSSICPSLFLGFFFASLYSEDTWGLKIEITIFCYIVRGVPNTQW